MEMKAINISKPNGILNPMVVEQTEFDENDHHNDPMNLLEDWLIENQSTSDIDPLANKETFIDADGTMRYTENWLPAIRNTQSLRRKAGCVEIAIQSDGFQQDRGNKRDIRFIADWKTLWMFLQNDKTDDVAVNAPLLRTFVEFFFHRKTAILATCLCIYDTIIIAIVYGYYTYKISTEGVAALVFLAQMAQGFIYLAMRYMYKGSLYGDDDDHTSDTGSPKHDVNGGNSADNSLQSGHNSSNSNSNINSNGGSSHSNNNHTQSSSSNAHNNINMTHLYTTHWSSTLVAILRHTYTELRDFLFRHTIHRNSPNNVRRAKLMNPHKKIAFYSLLNLSLKFLSRHTGMRVETVNFNRFTYRGMLMFTMTFLPIYILLSFYMFPTITTVKLCKHSWNTEPACSAALMRITLGFGNVTFILMHWLFVSSVMVALVGLAYGGEVAYRLSDSWIQRFQELRRIPLPCNNTMDGGRNRCSEPGQGDDDEESVLETSPLIQQQTEDRRDRGHANNSNGCDGSNNSRYRASEQTDSKRYISSNPSNKTASTATSVTSNKTTIKGRSSSSNRHLTDNSAALASILPHIQRDATEHYLFLREYINQASRIWSLGIMVMFMIFLFIIISFLYNYFALYSDDVGTNYFIYLVGYISSRFLILVIYPIVSISHANSFVYALQESFLVASPEDFIVIGGRDLWMNFLTSSPAVWTVYGLWITWDKLFGFFWAVLSGVAAVAITFVGSTNASG